MPQKKEWKTKFGKLTREELVALIRKLMAEGKSNKSAAKALGVKLGVVAGLRYKEKIPSTHKPSIRTPPPPAPPREQVLVVGGPKPRLAPPGKECTFVDEDGRQCALLPMAEEAERPWLQLDRCRLHQRKN